MSLIKMPFEFLTATVLSGIQDLINTALDLDPIAKDKIIQLEGNVVCVKCIAPNLPIVISVHQHGVLLSANTEQNCDATIEGSASALMNLLLAKDKATAIRQQEIQIQGNAALIQQLQDVMISLDIDWEYQLSRVIGDIPTQLFSDGLTQLQNFLAHGHERMSANLDEFLHEESALLPGKNELEAFYQRIDELRLAADRIQSRLHKLEIS